MRLTALFPTLLLSLAALCSCSRDGAPDVDYDKNAAATLKAIDQAVTNADRYVSRKHEAIETLRNALINAQSDQSRYDICYSLYEEYRPLANDSAIHFLDLGIGAARNLGDHNREALCLARKAMLCSNAGDYVESLAILNSVDTAAMKRDARLQYYFAMAHVCGELAFYSLAREIGSEYYGTMAWQFRQRIRAEAPAHSAEGYQMRQQEAMDAGDTARAMAINDQWLKATERGSHAFALVSMYRFYNFAAHGDTSNMIVWLGEAVLADIRNGVMDQGAMKEMARLLISLGDVDRAYRYICFASDRAMRFGVRKKASSISQTLTQIATEYKEAHEEARTDVAQSIRCIGVLATCLLLAILAIGRLRSELASTRDSLSRAESDLATTRSSLQESETELSFLKRPGGSRKG